MEYARWNFACKFLNRKKINKRNNINKLKKGNGNKPSKIACSKNIYGEVIIGMQFVGFFVFKWWQISWSYKPSSHEMFVLPQQSSTCF